MFSFGGRFITLSFIVIFKLVHGGYELFSFGVFLKTVRLVFGRGDDNNKGVSFLNTESLKILEFGNQEVNDMKRIGTFGKDYELFKHFGYEPMSEDERSIKPFYEHLGMHYTSIDINGLSGSLKLDVRQDLKTHIDDRFDIITNFGFSEHVGEGDVEENLLSNQYSMFRNMHDLGKGRALIFHEIGLKWHKHGVCYYTPQFFDQLARANSYEVLFSIESDHINPATTEWNTIIVAHLKAEGEGSNRPFMTFEEFTELPGIVSIYKDYDEIEVVLTVADGRKIFFQFDYNMVLQVTARVASRARCEEIETTVLDRNGVPLEQCVEYLSRTLDHQMTNRRRHHYITQREDFGEIHTPYIFN